VCSPTCFPHMNCGTDKKLIANPCTRKVFISNLLESTTNKIAVMLAVSLHQFLSLYVNLNQLRNDADETVSSRVSAVHQANKVCYVRKEFCFVF
jgi:hypothetical protein